LYHNHQVYRNDNDKVLTRSPDRPILVGGLRFYRDSVFFFCHLPSELAERNSTKTGHMLWSKCDLKMHVRNLPYIPSPVIGGPKTTFCRRFRNLATTSDTDSN